MRMCLRWVSIVVLSLLPAAGAAQSTNLGSKSPEPAAVEPATIEPAALASTIDAMLSGIERTSTDEEWARLGDAAVEPLVARMNDATRTVVVRGRATTALGNFKTAEVSAALRAVLAGDSPTLLLRKAIQSLAKVEGAASVDAIAPHLEHRSTTVREDAIKALGALALHGDARAALEKRRDAEPSKHLKRQIDLNLRPTVEAPQ